MLRRPFAFRLSLVGFTFRRQTIGNRAIVVVQPKLLRHVPCPIGIDARGPSVALVSLRPLTGLHLYSDFTALWMVVNRITVINSSTVCVLLLMSTDRYCIDVFACSEPNETDRPIVSYQTYVLSLYRLRYDYDPTTTYRARLLPFDAIRREQKLTFQFFVVVVS